MSDFVTVFWCPEDKTRQIIIEERGVGEPDTVRPDPPTFQEIAHLI